MTRPRRSYWTLMASQAPIPNGVLTTQGNGSHIIGSGQENARPWGKHGTGQGTFAAGRGDRVNAHAGRQPQKAADRGPPECDKLSRPTRLLGHRRTIGWS